ncbi:MAG: PTS sugar transporter subunit IIA [candidate division Zixibacteria bacterium]|nr:PTS sugar transporter subunit IIA [candidate division Zixibacteria bacterium]
MKLSRFCDDQLIEFDLNATSKEEALKELVELASRSQLVKDSDQLYKDVTDREALVTTGVGYGVAFPHAKTRATKGIVIAFGRSSAGIDFDAIDGKPVTLFFLIAAPEDAIGAHLNVMARLSYMMKIEENRDKLSKVSSPDELFSVIDSVA